MKLKRPPYPEVIDTPGYFFVHVGHRESAIDHAINVIRDNSDKELAACDDPITRDLMTPVGDWVVESLIQGAWIREYHQWEKATRRYFEVQHQRNGNTSCNLKGSHVKKVRLCLTIFGCVISDAVLDTLDAQRKLINSAKHGGEYLTTEREYRTLVKAIADFWSQLAEQEQFAPPARK